jgi:hypothetical protein
MVRSQREVFRNQVPMAGVLLEHAIPVMDACLRINSTI